jgi:tetratricopeptide (TPR) repeat protein
MAEVNRHPVPRAGLLARVARLAGAALLLASCAGAPRDAALAQEYYNLGNAHLELKNYERAVAMYREALRLDPELNRAYYNLSLALTQSGRAEEAVGILERLAARDPQNRDLLEALAYAYHAQGQDQKALDSYESILSLAPENTAARYNLAILMGKAGRNAEAIPHLQRLMELDPGDQQALYQLGRLLAVEGRTGESVAALERYVQERPEDAAAQALLGDGYRKLERYDRALEAYAAALTRQEKLAEARFYSALIYLTRIEDPQAGLSALQRALEDGFADAAQIAALLASPGLLEKEKVRELLAGRGLLPAPGGQGPAPGELLPAPAP